MDLLFAPQELEDILKTYFKDKYRELNFETSFDFLKDVEIRDDDVFLIGNKKSGTTWLQELVWLIGNDLDYEGAKVFIDERVPIIELQAYIDQEEPPPSYIKLLKCHWDSLNYVASLKSPRFIKTHVRPKFLPTQLLSGAKKAKIIYISRNAKDVCLSAYHYYKTLAKLHDCPLDEYCKLFMGYRPTHFESILYFWNLRNQENVLFLRYEEMKNNLEEVIQRVAKFLNKTITEEQQKELFKWLQFDQMKSNKAVNHDTIYSQSGFIREGKVGSYKTEMSPEIIAKFDIWIKESLKDSDYFEYE